VGGFSVLACVFFFFFFVAIILYLPKSSDLRFIATIVHQPVGGTSTNVIDDV